MMQNTYKLAKETKDAVVPFGPLMTLKEAQGYQADMEKAGFSCLVVNCASL